MPDAMPRPDAVLFHDDQLGGSHVHVHDPIKNLTDVSFNNDTSSIAIYSGTWQLFGGEDFKTSLKTPTMVTLGRGIYYTDDLKKLGLANDDLSSLKPV